MNGYKFTYAFSCRSKIFITTTAPLWSFQGSDAVIMNALWCDRFVANVGNVTYYTIIYLLSKYIIV